MTEHQRPQQPAALEDEGIPDHEGPLPEKERTGDAQEGVSPPGDRAEGATAAGVTAAEQRAGESTGTKLAREEPEVDAAGPEADDAGRLVQPDEGAHSDTEKDEVGRESDHTGLSAEEDAVHRGVPTD